MSSIKLSSSKDSSKKQSQIIIPDKLILQSDENNAIIYNQSSKKISSLTKSEIKSNSKFQDRMKSSREVSAEKNIVDSQRVTPLKSSNKIIEKTTIKKIMTQQKDVIDEEKEKEESHIKIQINHEEEVKNENKSKNEENENETVEKKVEIEEVVLNN
jgi:hypothetical protein